MNTQIETPEVTVPSIASASMLVELSISVWTGQKKDRKAQAKLEADNHTAKNVTSVTKKLMGDHPLLTQIQKHAATVRTNIHYAMTMPWADTGPRLLTTKRYFKYQTLITEAQQEHSEMVTEFLNEYEFDLVAIQARQAALGSLYDASEYPTADSLRRKFAFHVNYMPMPDSGDFRLDIANEAQEHLKEVYSDFYQRKIEEAMNDNWHRTYKVLSNMSERLADPEEGFEGTVTKKGHKKFADTLVSNAQDLIELLEACNITNDEHMNLMQRKLSDALMGVTPDALREDRDLRLETKRRVDEVLKNLPSLDW